MTADNLFWDDAVEAWLQSLDDANLRRHLRLLNRTDAMKVRLEDGGELVNFSSNDYLGLAVSGELKQAMIEAVGRYGVGSGASRLICGTHGPHAELEVEIAAFKGTESALAFSSGHAVAVGVLPALCGAGDTIILDKLSHASLIDGARLSGATMRVFPHNDVEKLKRLLATVREKNASSRVLIVTESVFSMDGDVAPLKEIVELKDHYEAWLLLDEAHGVGVLGPGGRGLVAEFGLDGRVELQMGTLSKAIGVSGGYLAAKSKVVDLLVNRARSLIYSTAPSPAIAATAAASVRLIAGAEGERRRQRLRENQHTLLTGLRARNLLQEDSIKSAIVPIVLGAEGLALEASKRILENGYLVSAIRYPTVARGRARLRVTLSALHEGFQIEGLVGSLERCLAEIDRGQATLPEVTP